MEYIKKEINIFIDNGHQKHNTYPFLDNLTIGKEDNMLEAK